MIRILENGLQVSPLFQTPWLTSDVFRVDWLHCADLGVTADFLGNMFRLLASKCEGNNVKQKTHSLWKLVQQFYADHNVGDKLQNLTPTMIQCSGKAPKLRCSAAQCRALLPFALKCAQTLLGDQPAEEAAKVAAWHLNQCYMALGDDSLFHHDVLKKSSTLFALQYVALHDHFGNPKLWRCKPKLHLFLELCAENSKPSLFWTYRDEDFGGSVAKAVRRRGGLLSCKAMSANLLERMSIMQPVVRMTAPWKNWRIRWPLHVWGVNLQSFVHSNMLCHLIR